MTSIAELGIRVNSTEAAQAATDLDKLAQSGAKAEKATVGLTQSTEKSEKSFKGMGEGAKGAEKSTEGLTKQTEKLGISAKQTAAALRGVPAQFTDIAVSLQGGQAPLTVLLQQGGQLKDMFGGVGPAARALGGYVAGLVNPFTLAGAAAVALAIAYNQGSKEADAFNNALILTGKVAGTTADALGTMARNVSSSVGTTGAAADVLAQLAGSGKVATDSFEEITVAALSMQQATGKAAEETVAEFVKIGKDPVAAAKELNDQYHFLTQSIYSQIVAAKESGNTTEASRLLTEAYANAIRNRTAEVTGNLGLIERAWLGIKNAALGALDATLNVGRDSTLGEQLADAKKLLADLTAGGRDAAKEDPFRYESTTKEIGFLEMQIEAEKSLAKFVGDRQKVQDAGVAAAERVDALTKSTYTNEQKRGEEIKKYKADLDKIREANPSDARLNQASIDKNIANINDKYKDAKAPKGPTFREDAGERLLTSLRSQESSLSAQLKSDDKLTEAERKRAEITQQIADLKTRSVLTADQKSLLASESGIKAQLDKNVAVAEEVRLHTETIKLQERSAQIQASIASASESKNDQRTTELSTIGLGRQAAERAAEEAATRKEFQRYQDQLNKATPKDQLGGPAYTIEASKIQEQLNLALAANEDYYDRLAEKQANWKNGASDALRDYMDEAQNLAGQTYDIIGGTMEALTTGIADSFAQSIVMGDELGESMRRLGQTVLTEVLSSMIQVGVRIAANTALEQSGIIAVTGTKVAAEGTKTAAELTRIGAVTTASLASTAATTTAQVAAAGTTLSAWLPAALVASVGSFGAAAIVGGTALLAAFALTKGFKTGGYTGDVGTNDVAGVVHGKEYVFDAASTARIGKSNLDAIRAGKMEAPSPAGIYTGSGPGAAASETKPAAPGGVIVNLHEDANRAGQVQTSIAPDGRQQVDTYVSDIRGQGKMAKTLEQTYGLKRVGR
ncbi:phage tail length tape measure family protein [Pseudomonas sp. YuFO20]|uniref:phage tail length tape measure family protein n=1 Tax=Pseudomonas sp. YuFO20 TaxID=3095362 RepID=UPI002B24E67E|nr:phage tail length tape measure family protein [Pseudomonas sp. YuFO20]MEB2514785.1 phage tail length tape measure family protein [Pseudomonas sp. YuFO20]